MFNNTSGMADATGVSTSIQFIAKRAADPSVKPEDVMPPARGLTDFMVVWDQNALENVSHWYGPNPSGTGFSYSRTKQKSCNYYLNGELKHGGI